MALEIFRDKSVFSPEYAPEKILLRQEELTRLERVMEDIYRNVLPRHLLIVGSYGIGKTLTIKWLHQKLRKDAQTKNLNIRSVYVNCKSFDTESKVVKRLLAELSDIKLDPSFPSPDLFTCLEKLCRKIDWALVILDDMNHLLRRVHGAYERLLFMPSRLISNIHFTMITNDLDLPKWMMDNIPHAIQETLRYETITFPPYDALQLEAILQERADHGFRHEAYDGAALRYIAAISSSRDLGARGAIDLARLSGEIAEENGSPRLTEEHVREALPKLEKMATLEHLKALSQLQRRIVSCIADRRKVKVSDVMKELEGVGPNGTRVQLGERLLTYQLSALRDMGVIVMERHGRGRARGVENWLYLNPDFENDLRWALKHVEER